MNSGSKMFINGITRLSGETSSRVYIATLYLVTLYLVTLCVKAGYLPTAAGLISVIAGFGVVGGIAPLVAAGRMQSVETTFARAADHGA